MERSARAPRSSSRAPAERPMPASCESLQRSSMRSSRPVARRDRAGGACHRRPRRRGRPRRRRARRRRSAPHRIASSTRSSSASRSRSLRAAPVTASIQPIHAAADRDLVEACWDGRQDRAYAWRSLRSAGAHLAAGSDAPVESVNPSGSACLRPSIGACRRFARRLAIGPGAHGREALSAYTLGPARALGARTTRATCGRCPGRPGGAVGRSRHAPRGR